MAKLHLLYCPSSTAEEVFTFKPAVWNDDPECGHSVACAYQTHYCTYIRVPRLLTLQNAQSDSERLLITALQWNELWFKVLLVDLRAAIAEPGTGYESVKLLRRGIELFRLLDAQLALDESVLVHQLHVTKALHRSTRGHSFSDQFRDLDRVARTLDDPKRSRSAAFAEVRYEYAVHLRAFRTRWQKFLRATLVPSGAGAPGYADWLRLSDLLSLQNGVKADWAETGHLPQSVVEPATIGPDENMFIIVHQCFELWFKVMLEHVDRVIPLLLRGDVGEATRLIQRLVLVERLLVQQIQIPATMLPLDFARFRHETLQRDGKLVERGLSPASGTESYQFRELEIVLGLRDNPTFQKYLAGSDKLPIRLLTPGQSERMQQPTLPEAFRAAVSRRGIARLDDLFTPANVDNPNADLALLADTLIELDEAFRFWRLGHVSMVEKMIGGKSGTGFLGPEYLMETAGLKTQKNRIFEESQVRPRFFEDLWQVRTRLGAYQDMPR